MATKVTGAGSDGTDEEEGAPGATMEGRPCHCVYQYPTPHGADCAHTHTYAADVESMLRYKPDYYKAYNINKSSRPGSATA